ncbi:MAG: hypothetical protein AAF466_12125 [Bacteroidota bacterium]
MYSTVQFLHSWWAYLLIVVVFLATVNALRGFFGDRPYEPKDFRLALFALIVTHIQFLIGFLLFILSPNALRTIFNLGIGGVMKNDTTRLLAVEHPLVMILMVVFITMGYSKHKKKLVSRPKFKMLSIFYTLAFVLMLSRIPWGQWF